MKLLFKQRFFSWMATYDIYNASGETEYTVKSQLSWGHCLKIFDKNGRELGVIKEVILTFMPKFEMYFGNSYVGSISKKLSLFTPKYDIDYNGWQVRGDVFEWDYTIVSASGNTVAVVSKELNWTDTYSIDVANDHDAIYALMFVLAIDAEKASRY